LALVPVFSDCIYEKDGIAAGTVQERALELMRFYRDDSIKAIFDISGGDLANGILPYLDYETIASSRKLFFGYSDLTTVLNAVYAKTGNPSVLYQIRNLCSVHKEQQVTAFFNTMLGGGNDLFDFSYHFVQGNRMQGVVIGGNIRCFLKLAGTEYMPDFQNKILLLESLSGNAAKMETYLCQLKQLGTFEKAAGILLGTFTEMEEQKGAASIEELVKQIAGEEISIVKTQDIGHGTDAKGIVIGEELCL